MKCFNYKYLLLIIFSLASFLFVSCREEIISPKNNSGNVNEPYKSSFRNSYTFILNAENLSQFVIDYPTINYSSSRIFISVLDYVAGSVEVVLLTKTRELVYRNRLAAGNTGEYAAVDGIKPEIVEFHFNKFSGKIKFQLTGIF